MYSMEFDEIKTLQINLLQWGTENFRHYPWRETRDPYKILIAEILLHRTKAEQVVPLYKEFIGNFPSINSVAVANFKNIREILASAGLFWRIELIHKMAKQIHTEFNGRIPFKKLDLLSLPGVGEYIASAVRCFAWGCPEIIADTNTVRITGRIFGVEVNDGTRRNKKFHSLMKNLMAKSHPREFNYALLDLGAVICLPHNPSCAKCPLITICIFGKQYIR